jgi:hypothetical protein
MFIGIKLDDAIFGVTGGAAGHVVESIVSGAMEMSDARDYLREQRIADCTVRPEQFGYIDFDNLTKEGRPTIVGEFYPSTMVGRKLLDKTKAD